MTKTDSKISLIFGMLKFLIYSIKKERAENS